jgi:hypothetical protein
MLGAIEWYALQDSGTAPISVQLLQRFDELV